MELKDSLLIKMNESFALGGDDILRFQDRLCVPYLDDLRTTIVVETYCSRYSIHLGSTKMYHDLKQIYWWDGMKKDIAEYVAKCPNCQQVKEEYIKTGSQTQIIENSYAYNKKWPLEFDVGDQVNLKISPMKGVRRFGSMWKLSPRYVGPYETLQYVGEVYYELALPTAVASIHPVFHVSILKKCLGDPASILPMDGLGVDEDLSSEEVPVVILDRQVK
ncbi:uncharacterized protein [Solanum lycopersicum]|uniref:uncharacterized protein n=1 Tax=Solanum lycopersicum TaxID=4081 RepID=UPI003749FAA4